MSESERNHQELDVVPSMTQRMAVAAVIKLFARFPVLEALQLIADGIDRNRFPDYIREDLQTLRHELKRVLDKPLTFVVNRLVGDIRELLDPYLDYEAQRMLEGLYANGLNILDAEMTEYHTVEALKELE
jgi:hypothetical protein